MSRADFQYLTDAEVVGVIYTGANNIALRRLKEARQAVCPEVTLAELEDFFVKALAKHYGIEELFPELFEDKPT